MNGKSQPIIIKVGNDGYKLMPHYSTIVSNPTTNRKAAESSMHKCLIMLKPHDKTQTSAANIQHHRPAHIQYLPAGKVCIIAGI